VRWTLDKGVGVGGWLHTLGIRMGGNARPGATHCRLAKAPRIGGAENFKTKDFGLVPLAAVRTWGPLVLVRFGHVWALYWAEARRVVAK
jgi:hypothetical protein